MTRVLVLGASGMLGSALLRFFAAAEGFEVFGSVRSGGAKALLPAKYRHCIRPPRDVLEDPDLRSLFEELRPDVVVNCIGVIKQLPEATDALVSIPVNSLLPHRVAALCESFGSRMVQISTDCVFSGDRGGYTEADTPDARDLYGRSKLLGEVDDPHAVTLRTSIIGHALQGNLSLVDWFLSQRGTVRGFTRAIFSGLPAVEFARIIRDHVLPQPELRGIYHLSAEPIAKFDLLRLVAEVYGRDVHLIPDNSVVIDRSLDSSRFREATGFAPESWPELVRRMHRFA